MNEASVEARSAAIDERAARLNAALADLAAARRARVYEPVTVRLATEPDAVALVQLAALDCELVPVLPALVAETSGRLVAALSLTDGAVIADPFVPTSELVALLRLRARQLRHADRALAAHGSRRGPLRWLRRAALGARA